MQPILLPDTSQRSKRLLRFVLRDALVIVAACLVLEFALRLLAPQYVGKAFSYRYTAGYPIAINPDGYRGEQLPVEKPQGEVRVLGLGDSITFGPSVASDDTWPHQLARMHERETLSFTRAINASMPAASVRELRHAFVNKWAAYEPDHVAIVISNNMVALAYTRRGEQDHAPLNGFVAPTSAKAKLTSNIKESYNRLALPRFISFTTDRARYLFGISGHEIDNTVAPLNPMLAYGFRQPNLDPTLADRSYALFESDLGDLVGVLRKRGLEPIVAYVPARFMLSNDLFDNEKRVPKQRFTIDPAKRIGEICRRLGTRYLDATGPLLAERARVAKAGEDTPDLYVQFDFTHLDARGLQVLAAALDKDILSRSAGTSPSPALRGTDGPGGPNPEAGSSD